MMVDSKKGNFLKWYHATIVEISHTFIQLTFVKCLLCASFGIGAKEVKEAIGQAEPGVVYILVEESVQNFKSGEAAAFRKTAALGLEQKQVGKTSPLKGAMAPEAAVELPPQPPLQHVTYHISSHSKGPPRARQPSSLAMCINAELNEPMLTHL